MARGPFLNTPGSRSSASLLSATAADHFDPLRWPFVFFLFF